MKKILNRINTGLVFLTILVMSGLAFSPAAAYACGDGSGSSKDQVLSGVGVTGNDCAGDKVPSTIQNIVSLLSYVVGVVSIIMIVVGGFKFVTTGGDSNKVSSAKNTIVYALVGLAVAALAQVLVKVVLKGTS